MELVLELTPLLKIRENFGRKRLNLTTQEISRLIIDQINILSQIAEKKFYESNPR